MKSIIARMMLSAVALLLILPTGAVFAAGSVSSSGGSTASFSTVPAPAGSTPAQGGELKPQGEKISQDDAIAKMRKLFPDFQKAEVQSVQFGSSNSYPARDEKVWDISWVIREGNSSYGFGSRVDAVNGDVLSMNLPYNNRFGDNEVYYPPKVSKLEAESLAKQFIQKAAPSVDIHQLVEQTNAYPTMSNQPLFGPVSYRLSFTESVDGVPSPGDTITVGMDGNGKITEFYKSYHSAAYPDSHPKISLDQAKSAFLKNLNLSLAYYPVRRNGVVSDWLLAWHGETPYFAIDAQTGVYLGPGGNPIEHPKLSYEAISPAADPFQPADSSNGPITAEQAAAAVTKAVNIPASRELTDKQLGSDYQNPDRKVWNLTWRAKNAQQYGFTQQTMARVDAETGQIIEYTRDSYGPPAPQQSSGQTSGQAEITEQQAEQQAIALVNRLYPDASKELMLQIQNWQDSWIMDSGKTFHYNFQRFYNGIAVIGDSVNISFNSSGQLLSYRVQRSSGLAQKLKGITQEVDREKAQEIYLASTETKLIYSLYQSFDASNDHFIHSRIKLVYTRTPKNNSGSSVIDAMSGEWISVWGYNAADSAPAVQPKDITGHWAEKPLKTLIEYHVLTADQQGNIHPEKPVTMGDWLQMMATAIDPAYKQRYVNYNNPFQQMHVSKADPLFPAVIFADSQKWIDAAAMTDQDLSAVLTREKLAKLLTVMLHYKKLSGYLDGSLSFLDNKQISAKEAVYLVSRLGLMNGSGNQFMPKQPVTRAQAAAILMRLVYLQGKTDSSVTGTH